MATKGDNTWKDLPTVFTMHTACMDMIKMAFQDCEHQGKEVYNSFCRFLCFDPYNIWDLRWFFSPA